MKLIHKTSRNLKKKIHGVVHKVKELRKPISKDIHIIKLLNIK